MTAKIRISKALYEDQSFLCWGPGSLFPNKEVHVSSKEFDEKSQTYVLTIWGPGVPNAEWVTARVDRLPSGTYETTFTILPGDPLATQEPTNELSS